MNKLYEIFRYLPDEISAAFRRSETKILSELTDIRLRTDCPIIAYSRGKRYFLSEKGLTADGSSPISLFSEGAAFILMKLCKNSLYAYEESIRKGFITADGGHRVGITGTAALSDGKISSVRDINGFYFRVARNVKGCCLPIAPLLTDGYGIPVNTIIVSPPGQGKTTLLRDCARYVSELGLKVCVLDERSEIGMSDSSVLPLCAILDGYPKGEGVISALRSLSPDLIVIDEIGDETDILEIRSGIWAGASFFATAHARSISELSRREGFSALIPYFDLCLMPRMVNGGFICDHEILHAGALV